MIDIVDEEDDIGLEKDDLQLTREQEHQLKYEFSVFNSQVDVKKARFQSRHGNFLFEIAKRAIKSYSIKERVKVHKVRNQATMIDVVCRESVKVVAHGS